MAKAKEKLDNEKIVAMWSELREERQKRRRNIYYMLYLLVIVIAIGATGFRYFDQINWLDAIYVSIATITTVGYGDIVPVTPAAKMFTIGFMLIGVGVAFYLLTNIGSYVLERREESFSERIVYEPSRRGMP